MNANGTIRPQNLIPEWWHIKIDGEDMNEIVFLGQVTIRQMIRHWRSDADSTSGYIKQVQEYMDFFEGKNAAAIVEIAKGYEKPTFPKIGTLPGNWSGEQEPIDPASLTRSSGATTFNFCGWCKHAGGGSCRYNYHITTSCRILSDAGITDEERRFNTPCYFPGASDKDFSRVRKGLEKKRDSLVERKALIDRKIKLLIQLEKKAEKKPALPDQRPHDWFNVADPLVCYIGGWSERIVPHNFATARVIDGYRHHDGCVSVCYDERIHNGEYLDGQGGGYGMSRPEVMHKWEYEYLLAHPDFASLWSSTQGVSKHLEGWSRDNFLAAMAKEANRAKKQ